MTAPHPVVAAVLAASVLGLAACGSDGGSGGGTTTTSAASHGDPAQYRGQLSALSRREDRAHKEMEGALRAKSAADLAARLARFAADQDSAAGVVGGLRPPADATRANALLARGFRDTAAEVRRLLPDVRSARSPRAAIKLITSRPPQRGGREVDEALAGLKKLGYTKGS